MIFGIDRLGDELEPADAFEHLKPKIRWPETPDRRSLLFVAWEKTGRDGNPLVSVEHRGKTYEIPDLPGCREGQRALGCPCSMQALALVKQLFGLNKSRENLPTTGVVAISGG